MFTVPPVIPPLMLLDDKRHYGLCDTVAIVKEAQDIYKTTNKELRNALITATIENYLFEVLPKSFDKMTLEIKLEMQKDEPLDSESYRQSRLLYDTAKPFFEKIGEIKSTIASSENRVIQLHISVISLLHTVKDYIEYLDERFLELDKPKFKSSFFTHIPESDLWAMSNKKRPYLL